LGDREKTHRRLENAGETTEPVVKQFSDRPPSERLQVNYLTMLPFPCLFVI